VDGNWHHYEFYYNFSTDTTKIWYDGTLKVNHTISGCWASAYVNYLTLGSIDAEEAGTFMRQFDDWDVWDGMPGSEPDEDLTPPYIDNVSPASGATGIPITSKTISFNVKDAGTIVSGVNTSSIVATIEGVSYTCASGLTCSGTSSNVRVSRTNASNWGYEQVVNVSVSASDVVGNAMSTQVWSFTTEANPEGPTISVPGSMRMVEFKGFMGKR
jgi:hypothetical protein